MTATMLLLLCLCLVVPSLGANLPYIIGGSKVGSASDYPWQCSILLRGTHDCGASIISKDWLVTAAHCVEESLSEYSICCGSAQWRNGTNYGISQITLHEDWMIGPGDFPNDIAVIKVSMSMDLSGANMAAIPMATAEQAGNSDCYITGWGYTTTGGGGNISEDLMEAKINVYTNTYCKEKWSPKQINDGHVCIGASGKGSCSADSGGPLACKVNGQFQLVGTTSWGRGDCVTTLPSVYTRITYFRSWITDKTGVH